MEPSMIDKCFRLESTSVKDKHLKPGHVVYAPYPGIHPHTESYYWGRISRKYQVVGIRSFRYNIEFADGDDLSCISSGPMHRLREALRLMEQGQIQQDWPPVEYEEIQEELEDVSSSSSYSEASCFNEEEDDFLPNDADREQPDELFNEAEKQQPDDFPQNEVAMEQPDRMHANRGESQQPALKLPDLEDEELDMDMSAEIDEYMTNKMANEEAETGDSRMIIDLTMSDSEEEDAPTPTVGRQLSVGKVIHSDCSNSSSSSSSTSLSRSSDKKESNQKVKKRVSQSKNEKSKRQPQQAPQAAKIAMKSAQVSQASTRSTQTQQFSEVSEIPRASEGSTQPSIPLNQDESSDEVDSTDDELVVTPKKRKKFSLDENEMIEEVEMPTIIRPIRLEQPATPKSRKDQCDHGRGKRVALKTVMGISPSSLPISRRRNTNEVMKRRQERAARIVAPSCGVLEKAVKDTGRSKGYWKVI